MRFEKIIFAVVLSTALNVSAAENGVMVDLSVLNNLSLSYDEYRRPLFPVLPKREHTVVRPSVKKVKKAPAPITIKESAKPTVEEKVVIKPEEPIKNAESETLPVEPAKNTLAGQVQKQEEPLVEVVDIEPAPVEPVVVVDVEPIAPQTQEENKQTVEQENKEPEATPMIEPTVAVETFQEIKEQQEPEQEAPATVVSETEKTALITPQPSELGSSAQATKDYKIVFNDGEDELNSEQMAKLNNIVGHFSNEHGSKIAIYAYNVNDGVDTFKKKRMSLNRAIEIRSYLIKQGYKNFSIKVINIKADSDKVNTVELEEI